MAAKTQRAEWLQPKEPATGDHEGEPFVLSPTDVFASGHPLVRKFPHLFKPMEERGERPEVERMTAAPGKKRGRK